MDDDIGCTGKTLYANWIDSIWNFGNNAQLPSLIIDGTIYRDGDANGILD